MSTVAGRGGDSLIGHTMQAARQTADLTDQTETPRDGFALKRCFVVLERLQPPSPLLGRSSDDWNPGEESGTRRATSGSPDPAHGKNSQGTADADCHSEGSSEYAGACEEGVGWGVFRDSLNCNADGDFLTVDDAQHTMKHKKASDVQAHVNSHAGRYVNSSNDQERVRPSCNREDVTPSSDQERVRPSRDLERVRPCDQKHVRPSYYKERVPPTCNQEHVSRGCNRRVRPDRGEQHDAAGPSSHGDSDQKRFVCKKCGDAFSVAYRLTKHMQTHSKKEPAACHLCGATFPWPSLLKKHMRKHTGDQQRYECRICGLRFSRIDHLTAHEMRHSGRKPHVCPTCGKRFIAPSDLKKHSRSHSGDRPYRCDHEGCRASFSRSDGLLLHQRRHAGLKTYSCAQCGAKFVDSSELSKHISVHMRDIQEKNDFGEEKDL